MNSKKLLIQGLRLAAGLSLAWSANTATIWLSTSPAGPIEVNDVFDVDIHLSDWNPADGMVDGITLVVGFDGSLFSYVSGAADDTGFLSEDQQPSYSVTDISGLAIGDRFLLSFFDSSIDADNTVGSVGGADNAGLLGQFQLRALAVGTGLLTPGADAGDEDFVFFDELLFNVPMSGDITWTGTSMTVVPEPAPTALGMLAAAVGAVLLGRRRRPHARPARQAPLAPSVLPPREHPQP